MYVLIPSDDFNNDLKKIRKLRNPKLIQRIEKLLLDIEQNPRQGIGKVERLKHYGEREIYSRRIDKEHRLVYEIIDDKTIVILLAAFGHY